MTLGGWRATPTSAWPTQPPPNLAWMDQLNQISRWSAAPSPPPPIPPDSRGAHLRNFRMSEPPRLPWCGWPAISRRSPARSPNRVRPGEPPRADQERHDNGANLGPQPRLLFLNIGGSIPFRFTCQDFQVYKSSKKGDNICLSFSSPALTKNPRSASPAFRVSMLSLFALSARRSCFPWLVHLGNFTFSDALGP